MWRKRIRGIKTRWVFRGLTWTHEKVQGRAGCGCCRGKEGEAIRKHSGVPKSLLSSSSLPKSNHHLHPDFLLLFYYFFDELIFTVAINFITFFARIILDTVTWLLIKWLNYKIAKTILYINKILHQFKIWQDPKISKLNYNKIKIYDIYKIFNFYIILSILACHLSHTIFIILKFIYENLILLYDEYLSFILLQSQSNIKSNGNYESNLEHLYIKRNEKLHVSYLMHFF